MSKALGFGILAYAISWSLWYGLKPYAPQGMTILLAAAYMFGPLLAALLMKTVDRREGMIAFRWRFSAWWLFSWIAPLFLVGGATALSMLTPGASFQTFDAGVEAVARQFGDSIDVEEALAKTPPFYIAILGGMLAGLIPNSIAAFGEETGWRGYMWSALRDGGFWKTSVIVGLVWGLWHAPLIIEGHNYGLDYPGAPWAGVAMMCGFCIAVTPLLGFLRDRTGSVIPAAIAHGTINALAGIGSLFIAGGAALYVNLPGVAGIAVCILSALLVAFLRRGRAQQAH